MATAVRFLRSRNIFFSDTTSLLLENGCKVQFFLRDKPVVRRLHTRCMSRSALIEKTKEDASITDEDIRNEPVVDIGQVDPASHTESNIGQFYTVPEEISTRVLSYFFTKRFQSECQITGSTSLMIRKPTLEVLQHLKGLSEDARPPRKFIFYGDNGHGKSLSLAHVLHYCYSAGWFILPVPSVFSWCHGKSELQVSTQHADRFDQPELASAWLQMCRSINSKFLTEVKTSKQYLFGKRDTVKEGEPFGKIIDMGFRRATYATDAVGVLLKEIRNNPSLRVLYAVNEFNGFFLKTTFKDAQQNWIKPKRLSLIHHFTKLLHPEDGLKNGAMVFALSRTGMLRSYIESYEVADLLRERGLSAVLPFTNIEVPRYSKEELDACLQFFKKRGVLTKDLNSQLTKEIAFLSDYEPPIVSALCRRS
ncbi:28S ribosomal protein S29, mitochondrial-like isoform X2 [Orbicella faveolata]|uniref:28S ribosomal protein S29, mitochondrial-like isoform X2 n=1 Tax=Orbicella faveolata TaxID=48498 RepID=UPI0009E3A0E0|nr:28S ribosomal protein S29, mitochondrial-like isoform X2 [Orbicella faveolata]